MKKFLKKEKKAVVVRSDSDSCDIYKHLTASRCYTLYPLSLGPYICRRQLKSACHGRMKSMRLRLKKLMVAQACCPSRGRSTESKLVVNLDPIWNKATTKRTQPRVHRVQRTVSLAHTSPCASMLDSKYRSLVPQWATFLPFSGPASGPSNLVAP